MVCRIRRPSSLVLSSFPHSVSVSVAARVGLVPPSSWRCPCPWSWRSALFVSNSPSSFLVHALLFSVMLCYSRLFSSSLSCSAIVGAFPFNIIIKQTYAIAVKGSAWAYPHEAGAAWHCPGLPHVHPSGPDRTGAAPGRLGSALLFSRARGLQYNNQTGFNAVAAERKQKTAFSRAGRETACRAHAFSSRRFFDPAAV